MSKSFILFLVQEKTTLVRSKFYCAHEQKDGKR
jgi:hypothetical protein